MARGRPDSKGTSASVLAIMVLGIEFAISHSIGRSILVGAVVWVAVFFTTRWRTRVDDDASSFEGNGS